MTLIVFLMLFPLLPALALMLIQNKSVRGAVVIVSSALIAAASVGLLILYIGHSGPMAFAVPVEAIDIAMTAVLLLISAYIIYAGIRQKKFVAVLVAAVQIAATVGAELVFSRKAHAENALLLDHLSLLMVMLVGVIGSLICVFSVGYMNSYHHHKHVADRSRLFFPVVFIFLSAMFGLVLSNNLMWLLFFWEITTFCSFLLIGYTKTEEAIRNAFRALVMNMIGGLAFLGGIVWLFHSQGVIEVDKLLGLNQSLVMIPVTLICFSGIVKSAQMPFSSWLKGAMVAPSPTSALLHSSTMVKAGVYIIVRLSPLLAHSSVGLVIALMGAVTFLATSLMAISERNIKKLLAYSTVATLGLIVTCAGVGTYQAVWTAMMLMIFHAVAKSLLFLAAGTVEHGIDSLNIEDMDGLVMKMPKVAAALVIGIAGMFIAPFGMLISKWAALEALIIANPLLAVIVIFGSAATLFFYTKLMGKLIMVTKPSPSREKDLQTSEWFALGTLSVLTIVTCLVFPLISKGLVGPYIQYAYAQNFEIGQGNVLIMLIMMVFLLLLPLQILLQGRERKKVGAYLCGANTEEILQPAEANVSFFSIKNEARDMKLQNYYLDNVFGEKKLWKPAVVVTSLLLCVMCGVMFL